MTAMVSLLPAIKPNLSQSDRFLIIAVDLTDAYGRPMDGNDDGAPGGNYVAIVTKNGVTAAAVAAPATMAARAVDAVLERSLPHSVTPPHRGRSLDGLRAPLVDLHQNRGTLKRGDLAREGVGSNGGTR